MIVYVNLWDTFHLNSISLNQWSENCQHNVFLNLYAGDENDLPLKIEALVDGSNDACVKGEGVEYNTNQLVEDQSIHSKGKRLSEAILTLQNQCQAR